MGSASDEHLNLLSMAWSLLRDEVLLIRLWLEGDTGVLCVEKGTDLVITRLSVEATPPKFARS